jgi:signal transduction histidine kinase
MHSLLLFIVGALNSLVAITVVLRSRRLSNLLFFAISIIMAIWTVMVGLFLQTNSVEVALLYAKIIYLAPVIFTTLLLLFIQVFPREDKLKRKGVIPPIVFGIIVAVPLLFKEGFIIQGVVISQAQGNAVTLDALTHLFYTVYFVATFYLGLLIGLRKYQHETSHYRGQVGLYTFGLLINSLPGVTSNLLLPMFHNYRYVWVGPLATFAYVLAAAYAIVRYRLFDIRLVVARSLGYILTIGLLVGGYVGAFILVTTRLSDYFGSNDVRLLLNISGIAVTALTYAPVKLRFDRLSNRLFYRDAYDPQVLLDRLNQVLVSTIDLDTLLEQISQIIAEQLKAEFCSFGINKTDHTERRIVGTRKFELKDGHMGSLLKLVTAAQQKVVVADLLDTDYQTLRQELLRNNIAIVGRLNNDVNTNAHDTGYLILGPKKSGNIYNRQDVKLIEIIVNELVIAVQNALQFEEIQKFNVTLQERIETATKELKRSNEKLKALDEAKDDFISMASHQLRTPLTSVKGCVSMVLEGDAGKITDMQRRLLDQAFISSQRMVFLIADLLNVSRLRTGKFVIEPAPANLAEIIAGEIRQLAETAKGRNLTLSFDKPKDFPTLMLDETKIRQVIMNFIDNAIYYTPSGGHVTVQLQDKGSAIECTVTDDGIGVPKAAQHHLFGKFYRAENAKKARPDGNGLGLFMARKVVAAQGGAIIFRSQEGKGSTFGFTFPKAKLQVASPGATAVAV